MTTELKNQNIQDVISESSGLSLVDFWAPWCGPCRMIGPIVEDIAREYEGRLSVYKVNVDDNQQAAVDFRITGIPALVIFQDGKEVRRIVGAVPKQDIVSEIDLLL